MRVRPGVLEAIETHARQEAPRECCGLLIGTAGKVVEAVPAANVSGEPLRRYEVAPKEYLAQIKRCRAMASRSEGALGVIGVYHSHPHSAAEPSPTDLEQAFHDFLYLIAGPVDGALEIRAYRLEDERFLNVSLEVIRGGRG